MPWANERELTERGRIMACRYGNLGNRLTCDCVACEGWRVVQAQKVARRAQTVATQREKRRRLRAAYLAWQRTGVG